MTMLSLGEASRLSGRGKTTLARAIRRGALSATRTETGSYQIDPAELSRAFPFPAPQSGTDATGAATCTVAHHATPDVTTDILVATLRQTIEDLRQDRDAWREAAQQAQRLLAATPAPSGT